MKLEDLKVNDIIFPVRDIPMVGEAAGNIFIHAEHRLIFIVQELERPDRPHQLTLTNICNKATIGLIIVSFNSSVYLNKKYIKDFEKVDILFNNFEFNKKIIEENSVYNSRLNLIADSND